MPKFIIDKLEDAPEALRSHYTERADGKWVFQIEGAVPSEKLKEFRDKNTELLKAAEAFKDVDPEEYRRLLAIKNDLEKGKLKDGKTVEEVIEERTGAMKKQFETEKA